jgi:hypothetical protein
MQRDAQIRLSELLGAARISAGRAAATLRFSGGAKRRLLQTC